MLQQVRPVCLLNRSRGVAVEAGLAMTNLATYKFVHISGKATQFQPLRGPIIEWCSVVWYDMIWPWKLHHGGSSVGSWLVRYLWRGLWLISWLGLVSLRHWWLVGLLTGLVWVLFLCLLVGSSTGTGWPLWKLWQVTPLQHWGRPCGSWTWFPVIYRIIAY